jgi:hypothetical protein
LEEDIQSAANQVSNHSADNKYLICFELVAFVVTKGDWLGTLFFRQMNYMN